MAPLLFDLVPHVGIGPVRLGMTLAEVQAVLATLPNVGQRASRGNLHYAFDASLQFELGVRDTIHFIGLASHPRIVCRYLGHDVFDTPAAKLFNLIASREPSAHHYRDTEYVFPEQGITLYEADEQYDKRQAGKRMIWGQVGVGTAEFIAGRS